jgi:phospholipid transport system substrate-binding protein
VIVWRSGVIVATVLALGGGAGRAEDSSPTAVVQRLDDALLATLKDGESLGYDGRYARLQPVMRDTFDLDFMAEKALGQSWQQLSPADQTRWRELFADFTVANYAANFDRFTGQRFEVLGEESSVNDSKLVKTKVVTPGTDDVALTYRLQKGAAGWRIVDVYLKGTVSELALRRSDFASLLERDGFDALATALRGKIADLAAGRAKRERP